MVFGFGRRKRELAQAREQAQRDRAELIEMHQTLAVTNQRVKALEQRIEAAHGEKAIIERFHQLYYRAAHSGGTWNNTFWMGVPTQKCPLDLWVYQEILHETRPKLIVETGTANGGSALYLASLCDLLGAGRVVSVDIARRGPSNEPRPEHSRVRYLLGSSTDEAILSAVFDEAEAANGVFVILDSDHSEKHVLEELRAYSPLVGLGGYLVVEDTNVGGYPVRKDFGPGPMEAVEGFLRETDAFVVDETKEKFYMTFNPRGYLKRVK